MTKTLTAEEVTLLTVIGKAIAVKPDMDTIRELRKEMNFTPMTELAIQKLERALKRNPDGEVALALLCRKLSPSKDHVDSALAEILDVALMQILLSKKDKGRWRWQRRTSRT